MPFIDPKEYDAALTALDTYCREGCAANIPAVKTVFHEKAVMNGCGGGEPPVFGPVEALYELFRQVGPTEGTYRVDVLDITEATALGRCVIQGWHGKDFVDYHEMMKVDGRWLIVAKVYCQLDGAYPFLTADYGGVRDVLETYARESLAADEAAVRPLFHEKAVMNGTGLGAPVFGSIEALYELFRQYGPAQGGSYHADVLDIAGDTAVGRVVMKNCHGVDYVDYHELMRVDSRWKILAKLYQAL